MIIGNLPETQSVEDNDFLMLSKDNQKLLKIKKKNFAKGMGGGGKGLKYWVETEESFERNGLYAPDAEDERQIAIDNGDQTFTWFGVTFDSMNYLNSAVYVETDYNLVTKVEYDDNPYKWYPTYIWDRSNNVEVTGTTFGMYSKYTLVNSIYYGVAFGKVTGGNQPYDGYMYFQILPQSYSSTDSETIKTNNTRKTVYRVGNDGELTIIQNYRVDDNDEYKNYTITYNHIVYAIGIYVRRRDPDPFDYLHKSPLFNWSDADSDYINMDINLNGPINVSNPIPAFPYTDASYTEDRMQLDTVIREILSLIGFTYIRPVLGGQYTTGIGIGEKRIYLGEYTNGQNVDGMWVDDEYNVHAAGFYIGEDTPAGGGSVVPIVLSGTEIAKINDISIYAPSGGGGLPNISATMADGIPVFKDWDGTSQIYLRTYSEISLNSNTGSVLISGWDSVELCGVYSLYSKVYDLSGNIYSVPYNNNTYYTAVREQNGSVYLDWKLPSSDFTAWVSILYKPRT